MRLETYLKYENLRTDKDLHEIYKCPNCEKDFKIGNINVITPVAVIIKYANTINEYKKGNLVKTLLPHCPNCNESLLFSKSLDVNLFPNER